MKESARKPTHTPIVAHVVKHTHILQYTFISGIMLLIGFVGGYLVFANKATQPQNNIRTNQFKQRINTVSLTIQKNNLNNSTSDWKTFTNTTYHYSFKYPPQFTITETYSSKKPLNIYSYSFSTGKIVNGQPDWSGFDIDESSLRGKPIEQMFNSDPRYKSCIAPMPTRDNADEVDYVISPDGTLHTIYRNGDNSFDIIPFQNANALDDGSDAITLYLFQQIADSLTFQR